MEEETTTPTETPDAGGKVSGSHDELLTEVKKMAIRQRRMAKAMKERGFFDVPAPAPEPEPIHKPEPPAPKKSTNVLGLLGKLFTA